MKALALLLLFAATTANATIHPRFCGTVTDSLKMVAPSSDVVARPGWLTLEKSTAFGVNYQRITQTAGSSLTMYGYPAGSTYAAQSRHGYSKRQAWSADGKYVMIYNNGSPRFIWLDGSTFLPVWFGGKRDILDSLGVDECRWHPTMPDCVYAIDGGADALWLVNVAKRRILQRWSFDINLDDNSGTSAFNQWEGNVSMDGRWICVSKWPDSGVPTAQVLDLESVSRRGPVYSLPAATGVPNLDRDWITISAGGGYVVQQFDYEYARVFRVDPASLALSVQPMKFTPCTGSASGGWIPSGGHPDFFLNPYDGGSECIVGNNAGGHCPKSTHGNLMVVRLSDGKVTNALPQWPGSNCSPDHISTRCQFRPGWACISFYESCSNTQRWADEIAFVKLDGSGQMQRFGHSHTQLGDYDSQAQPTPDPWGLRVMFASTWTRNCSACGTAAEKKSFVIEALRSCPEDPACP